MSLNIFILRESFNFILPIHDQIISRFYENLFKDYPDAKPLFGTEDTEIQNDIFLNSFTSIIENLENQAILKKYLTSLGRLHASYNIKEIHYVWAGQSLLKTLSQFFGTSWTMELNEEWSALVGFIAKTMSDGCQNAQKDNEQESTENLQSEKVSLQSDLSSIKFEIPKISDSLKQSIKFGVKALVLKQIKSEVQKYLEEEIKEIQKLSGEDLVLQAIES